MLQFILLLSGFAYAQMGLVNSTKGDAKLTRDEAISVIKIGAKIYPKDVITTGADSFVKIITSDKNVFIIQENTKLEISSYISAEGQTKGSGKLNLKDGALHSEIKQKYEEEGNTFRIRTPSAVAGIRGTEFLTTATEKETTISTFSGQVMMAAKEENGKLVSPISVGAGFQFSGQVGQMGNAGKFMGQPMKIDSAKLDQLKSSAMSGQFKNMPQQQQQQPGQQGKPGQQGSPQNGGQKSQAPGMKREQMGPPKDKQSASQMGNMNPQDKKSGPNQTDDSSQKKKGPQNNSTGGPKGPGSGPGMPPSGMKPGMMPNGPRPGAPAGGMMPPPPPPPPPGGNGP